jgi:hypothetical protein
MKMGGYFRGVKCNFPFILIRNTSIVCETYFVKQEYFNF